MPGDPFYAILHYAGRGFAGWQLQPRTRTVQAEFESALARLAGERVVCHAAGRTDAGVHALGQVVSFTMPKAWLPEDLLRALRAVTPDDVWVARVGSAPPGFHARRDARSRRYRYVIGCDTEAFSPFRRPFEWALGVALDGDVLSAAGGAILGRHDFTAYAAVGQDKPHHHCTVSRADWAARPDAQGFIFTIEADRFLHHMVRFLVGTMVDAARGRRPVDDVARLLTTADNRATSPPAPPHGLYLVHVSYPKLEEASAR